MFMSLKGLIVIDICRNNECPACRTHCASRRSLRDDPNFDALVAAIYPDLDKYEEEVSHTLFTSVVLVQFIYDQIM
jgi:hypothetical protein